MGEAEVAEEYEASLQDLKDNSKPMITMLTMLADENKNYAGAISKEIEKRILQFAGSQKLSPLYLLDSIIKNVGSEYVRYFKLNIADTFSTVFERCDEKTRKKMHELRQTWSGIFPNSRLYQLDSKVRLIDPNWPKSDVELKAETYGSTTSNIHVNPNVIKASKSLPNDIKLKKEKQELIREKIEINSMKKEEELIEQERRKLEMSKQSKIHESKSRQRSGEYTVNKKLEQEQKKQSSSHDSSSKRREEKSKKNQALNVVETVSSKVKKDDLANKNVKSTDQKIRIESSEITTKEVDRTIASNSRTKDEQSRSSKEKSRHHSRTSSGSKESKLPSHNSSNKKKDNISIRDPRQPSTKIKMNLSSLKEKELFGAVDIVSTSESDTESKKVLNNNISIPKSNLKKTYNNDKASRKSVTFGRSNNSENKSPNPSLNLDVENKKSDFEGKKSVINTKVEIENKKSSVKSDNLNKKPSKSAIVESKSVTSKSAIVESKSVTSKPAIVESKGITSKSAIVESKNASVLNVNKSESHDKNQQTTNKTNIENKSTLPIQASPNSGSNIDLTEKKLESVNKKVKLLESPKSKRGEMISKSKSSTISNLKSKVANTILNTEKPSSETFKSKSSSNKSRTHIRKRDRSPEEVDIPTSNLSSENSAGEGSKASSSTENSIRESLKASPASDNSDREGSKPLFSENSAVEVSNSLLSTSPDVSTPNKDDVSKAKMVKLDLTVEEESLPLVEPIVHYPVIPVSTDSPMPAAIQIPEDVPSNADVLKSSPVSTSTTDENLFGKEDVDLRRMPTVAEVKVPCPATLEVGSVPSTTSPPRIAPMDSDMRIAPLVGTPTIEKIVQESLINTDSPNSQSWENFRNKNPEFKKYKRAASICEEVNKTPKCALNFDNHTDGPQPKRKRIEDEDEDGNQSPETSKFTYNNLENIAKQVNEDMRDNKITSSQHLKALSTVHVMMQKKKIEEFKRMKHESTNKRTHDEPEETTLEIPQQAVPENSIHHERTMTNLNNGPPYKKRFVESNNQIRIPRVSDLLLDQMSRQPETKTIQIDGITREIRTYGHIGIVLFSWNDPRVISFQHGKSKIVFDDYKFMLTMRIGENYRKFTIDGQIHKIRLGLPTQEFFLDRRGYQCIFGGPPVRVKLAGKTRLIALKGMLPKVDIGKQKNTMFLAGKVQVTVDATRMFTLYLDARPQRIKIDKCIIILKLIDSLRAILVNGIRFAVEFGGLPISVSIARQEHFISFSALPEGIVPGDINLIGMTHDGADIIPDYFKIEESLNLTELVQSELREQNHPPVDEPAFAAQLPTEPNLHPFGMIDTGVPPPFMGVALPGMDIPPPSLPCTLPSTQVSIPPPLCALPATQIAPSPITHPNIEEPIKSELKTDKEIKKDETTTSFGPDLSSMDINSLMQSLYRTGIIGNKGKENKELKSKDEERDADMIIPLEKTMESKYLKKRKKYLITDLYSGMQCSACGLRFLTDQTAQYSMHLDWHFRQNKRQQDSTRKPNARKWYFSTNDWNIFEEIEDLDERVPSMFENDGNGSLPVQDKEEIPSVPQSQDDPKAGICPICHDPFPQFFHQEKEDWHYRNATTIDGINYHPTCYEDKMKLQNPDTNEDPDEMLTFGDILEISVVKKDKVLAVVDLDELDDDDTNQAQYSESITIEDQASNGPDNNNVTVINKDTPPSIEPSKSPAEVHIKEEPIDDSTIQPIEIGAPTILADLPLRKIKVEEVDVTEEPVTPMEPPIPTQSAKTDAFSSIDGNTDLSSTPENSQSAITPKIKISISSKSVGTLNTVNGSESPTNETIQPDEVEDTFVPPPFTVDYSLKPGFKGVKLREQDTVVSGFEASNLCSIM